MIARPPPHALSSFAVGREREEREYEREQRIRERD
jgi:hypothetical protein